MQGVEYITSGETLLAILVRGDVRPGQTTFLTSDEHTLQMGFIVYPAGKDIPRHVHKPVPRSITGTCEMVMVRRGACGLDVYDADRQLVASRDMTAGDAVLLLSGGHGFRTTEDTVLFEVKQGPYSGLDEKERF